MTQKTILVTGATGAQGGAVVDAALAKGWKVRALVRSPERDDARALAARGVEIAQGSYDEPASLDAACRGVDAVFSVQMAMVDEVRNAERLIAAAKAAGVSQMVHSSVSATGWRKGRPAKEAADSPAYWDCKETVEALMHAAGFAHVTILKPAFMMENFILPKSPGMFPDLAHKGIFMALPDTVPLPLIAAADIGTAAMTALEDPARFDGAEVDLAGDALTTRQIGAAIGDVVEAEIEVHYLPAEAIIARGQFAGWVESQVWSGKVGYTARPEHQRAFGLTPTSFATWARDHRDDLLASTGSA